MIPYAEWLPDQPDLQNPGATVAKNCRPHASGYIPLPTLQNHATAMPARPRGAISTRNAGGVTYTYAGDATSLYELTNLAWTDVTRVSGVHALGDQCHWEFAKWNEDILAVGGLLTEPQKIEMGGANFADLAGTPPKARHVAVSRNFVIMANTRDADGDIPNRVRWCAADDEESWTVSAATQADKEDLYGPGGWINRVWGGEYAVIMQEHSIWRMSYVGSPVIWQFDEVMPGRGLFAPGATSQVGDKIFYLSSDGFMLMDQGCAGGGAIGAQKVDRFVLSDIDSNYLDRIKAAADPDRKHWYMIYPGSGNTSGRPNRMVIYDWEVNRWSYAELELHLIDGANSSAYTMDGLDAVNGNLDLIAVTLDSNSWKGGPPQIAAWDSSFILQLFTGTAMEATLETAEVQQHPGKRTMVNAVRPLVDGGSTTVQVGSRQAQSEAVSWSATASVNARGRATLRDNARYHRFRTVCGSTWEHAIGVEVAGVGVGWR